MNKHNDELVKLLKEAIKALERRHERRCCGGFRWTAVTQAQADAVFAAMMAAGMLKAPNAEEMGK